MAEMAETAAQPRPEDPFVPERIGIWSEPTTFAVEQERTIAYALATKDDIKQHVEGIYAPPVFAVVPPFTQLAAVTLEPVPPNLMMRIVHGEQDIRIHRPIVPGDVLSSRGKVVGIHGKGSGVVVTTLLETRDADGELVNEQYVAGFFRGGHWPHEAGEPFAAHDLDPAVRERTPDAMAVQTYDADQTHRYAEASGDPMPIHTDDAFAKAMGFPGIIVHGLCTMAMTSHAVIAHACPGEPERLKRLVVRFSAPGRPEQTITTNIWDVAPGRVAFETTNNEGAVLIKDGYAEIGE
jgi:acyl dehydratase